MKTFRVEKEILRGVLSNEGEVYSDGEEIDPEYSSETEFRTMTTGFTVHSYEDEEHLMTDFYPVTTNMTTWEDNTDEVMAQIKRDYPAGEWQNNEW